MAGELVTLPWHLEWRGQVYGYPLSAFTFSDVSGWLDTPPPRSTSVERPGRHGLFLGKMRGGGRTIEVELTLATHDLEALHALQEATVLEEDPQEEPLVIWSGTVEPQYVLARLERRAVPTDYQFSMGHHRARLQWVASDPRRYSVTEQGGSVGVPNVGSGGLEFPLEFPLDFGAGRGGSTLVITNEGSVAVWPVFTMTGPITGPIITLTNTGQSLVFDPTWTIAAGETVVVDTDARSVLLSGVPRDDRLHRRDWFPLAKGVNTIQFDTTGSYDPAAALSVAWRHGYM